ncbi:helix-turn-helix transcriptional regulator [Aerococcaceae bacterium zg-ZUI334]|uniref:helix-turn-helix domain-containing protein n=1 Tax=Aerococcaceae TaxID=186827 RepID=UPI0013D2BA60|nr:MULTISPECIES: helix-turn-helix domain-containing protein [unclassified Facklamia]MBR7927611.1 helix-turn-helix transcriptional regulator [Aerococcaceae bacterium zg-ZUI334]QQD65434.1 helix-turn-helix transcriptional regulator [Aerococcaceae bacterium zg-252]
MNRTELQLIYKERDKMLVAVQECNAELAKKIFFQLEKDETIKRLGIINRIESNQLRSVKNFMLSYNTQYFMAGLRGNLDIMVAHRLAESFAVMIEDSQSVIDLQEIMIMMLETYSDSKYRVIEENDVQISDKVDNFIEQEFMNQITISQIAQQFNMNKEYLMRVYKKEKSMTIHDKITIRRIQEAKKLLQYTHLSILEIAMSIGFSTSQYFSTTFKKMCGFSPTEYRKNC